MKRLSTTASGKLILDSGGLLVAGWLGLVQLRQVGLVSEVWALGGWKIKPTVGLPWLVP